MFFNFVFMFLWFYPPSAKTETKDTYKIPWWLYVNRGHFYFGQRGQPDFGFRGQINLAAGVIRAWVFQTTLSPNKSALTRNARGLCVRLSHWNAKCDPPLNLAVNANSMRS